MSLPTLGLVLVLLASAAARMQLLDMPLERDEGAYAYFGQLLLDGRVAYIDFYEFKPPGLYYAYAAVLRLFGSTASGLHLGFAAVNLISTVLVQRVGARLLDPGSGTVAAAAFAVLSLSWGTLGFAAHSEHLIVLFGLAAAQAVLWGLAAGSRTLLFLGGALAAAALSIKQSGLFAAAFAASLIALDAWIRGALRSTGTLRSAVAFAAGAAALLVAAAGAMGIRGNLAEFWFWVVEFPRGYATGLAIETGLENLGIMLPRVIEGHGWLWAVALAGLPLGAVARLGRFERGALLAAAVLGALSVVPGLRFYGHYWLLLVPAAALGVGVSYRAIRDWLRDRLRETAGASRTALAVGSGLALLLVGHSAVHRDYYWRPDVDGWSRHVYGLNPFPEARWVGEQLRREAAPGDTLAVVGAEPQAYFTSGLRCPSRHAYFAFLLHDHPQRQGWLDEFQADVERERPRFLVYFANPVSMASGTKRTRRAVMSWERGLIADRYEKVGVADTTGDYQTTFVWGAAEAAAYRPRGASTVTIYELRDAVDGGGTSAQ